MKADDQVYLRTLLGCVVCEMMEGAPMMDKSVLSVDTFEASGSYKLK
jgi:hypothetical protein